MPRWIGRKMEAWERVKAELKPRFEAAGITQCEFGYKDCWRDNGLSFAHVDKRLNLEEGELYKVALACAPCHNKLEHLPRMVMRRRVLEAIAKRARQP